MRNMIIFFSILSLAVNAFSGQIITVPDDHKTIQEAIRNADAGDTVFVKAGIYEETIQLKNGVNLVGEDTNSVTIRYLASRMQHVILARYPVGLIKNLTVEHYGFGVKGQAQPAGIFIVNSSVEIDGCRIRRASGSGIIVKDKGSPHIHNCIIENNYFNGIQVLGTDVAPKIKNNIIRHNRLAGIYFSKSSKGMAENNICEKNKSGILAIHEGTNVELKKNHCWANKEFGIYVCTGANALVEGNICSENEKAGILVYQTGTKAILKDNRFLKNKSHGIFFSGAASGQVENNICEQNEKSGIFISGQWAFVELKGNQCFRNAENGIFFSGESAGLAEENICSGNRKNGICVMYNGVAPKINNNLCSENEANGIFFGEGAGGTAEGNICSNNIGYGLVISNVWTSTTQENNQCNDNKTGDIYLDEGEFGPVRLLLVEENFDRLELIASRLRNEKTMSYNGEWQLNHFYYLLTSGWTVSHASQEEWLFALINRWIKEEPESITARIVLAKAYVDYAWEVRGGGWAYEVKPEGWEKFYEKLQKAWNVLEESEKLNANDPELYNVLITVAMGMNKSDARVQNIFEKGIAVEKLYYPIYLSRAQTLMLRWGGFAGQLENFADRAVELAKDQTGQSLYARIAVSVLKKFKKTGSNQFTEKYNFSYQRIKQGLDGILKQYPNSDYFMRAYRLFACVYGDKKTARELFDKIGAQWDGYYALCSEEQFEKYRDWAYEE